MVRRLDENGFYIPAGAVQSTKVNRGGVYKDSGLIFGPEELGSSIVYKNNLGPPSFGADPYSVPSAINGVDPNQIAYAQDPNVVVRGLGKTGGISAPLTAIDVAAPTTGTSFAGGPGRKVDEFGFYVDAPPVGGGILAPMTDTPVLAESDPWKGIRTDATTVTPKPGLVTGGSKVRVPAVGGKMGGGGIGGLLNMMFGGGGGGMGGFGQRPPAPPKQPGYNGRTNVTSNELSGVSGSIFSENAVLPSSMNNERWLTGY